MHFYNGRNRFISISFSQCVLLRDYSNHLIERIILLRRAPKRSGMDSNTVMLDRPSDGYRHSEKRPRCDTSDAAIADNSAEHPETIDIGDDEDERIKMVRHSFSSRFVLILVGGFLLL